MRPKSFLLNSIFTIFFLIINSCSTDPDDEPIVEPDVLDIIVADLAATDSNNEESSSDFVLSYSLQGDVGKINSVKYAVAKATTSLSQEQVSGLSSLQNLEIQINTKHKVPENLKDSDGDDLVNDVPYKFYLLISPKSGSALLQSSEAVTLTNEIIVTSLNLSPGIEANEDLLIDADNNVYVCGGWRSPTSLFRIRPDGSTSIFSTVLETPVDATFNTKGEIFVSAASGHMYKVSDTGKATLFSNSFGAMGIDNTDNIYVVNFGDPMIYKLKSDGVKEEFATSPLISGAIGLEYDKVRDVFYLANWNDGKILKVEKSGEITEIVDTNAKIGRMSYADDKFYITGNPQNQVYILNLSGEILTTIGSGADGLLDGSKETAQFSNPNGIEITPDGKALYIASKAGGIRKIIL